MKNASHRRYSRFATPFALLVAVFTACTPPATPTPQPPTTVIREETRILNSSARTSLLEAKPDGTLVFSSVAAASAPGQVRTQDVNPSQLKTGDVIVSEPTTVAPYGLLRKVTGTVSSPAGTISLSTTQGRIGDAIKSGRLTVTNRALTASDVQSVTPLAEGTVRLLADLNYAINVVLLDQDGNSATTNDQVRASGSINLKPSFDVDIRLDCGFLCIYDNDLDFLFKLSLQETAKLQIVGKVGYGASLEKSVFRLNFTPITFFIGPVPVVITPRLTLKVRLDGSVAANVDFQTTQTVTAVAGVEYINGWDNISSITNSFAASTATAALAMNATARAPLQAEFLFYGVVGPTIGVSAKLNFDVVVPRDPVWKLSGGVEGTIGIKVDVLGYTKEYSKTLFDLMAQIAQASNTAPTVKFSSLTANQDVDVNICCTFQVLVGDLEDGITCCATTFSSSVDGPLGSGAGIAPAVSKVLTTLGPRTITAITRDSKGATATASVTINAVNTPPTVIISTPFSGQQFYQGLAYTLHGSSYDRNEPNAELSCAGVSLRWTTGVALDPQVTGCDPQITFASPGPRTLTLTGTDAFGATGTVSVNITVLPPPANYPPVVNITKPSSNLVIQKNTVLQLAGTATDPEGGATTTVWDVTSNYNPATGTGDTPKVITLGAGGTWKPADSFDFSGGCEYNFPVRLRLRAKDPQGVEGFDYVMIQLQQIC